MPGKTDGGLPGSKIKASSVTDPAKRQIVESIIANTQQHIAAQICLLPVSPLEPHKGGLQKAVMQTALGKIKAIVDESDPGKSKYIGIFYDTKVTGEANSKPHLRVPPLRPEPFKRLIELARTRDTADDDETISDGDMFFLLDGGRQGNQHEILRPFQGKKKHVKTYVLWRDEESQLTRLQRNRGGINTCRQHETMYVVSCVTPSVKAQKFQNYKGSAAGTLIGPIVMPPQGDLWQAQWSQKKDLYLAENIIAVGGKFDDDDDAGIEVTPTKQKARTPTSVEPVFYHCLPESFFAEMLGAFPLAGILDLTPADGALATAAYKMNIVYVGLCFGDTHVSMLQKKIESNIWHSLSNDTDAMYDPRLVAALLGGDAAAPDPGANPAPKAKAKAKAKGESKPKPKPKKGTKRPRTDAGKESEGEDQEDVEDSDTLSMDGEE